MTKKYKVAVEMKFYGWVEVEANNSAEAEDIADDNVKAFLQVHPEPSCKNIKEVNVSVTPDEIKTTQSFYYEIYNKDINEIEAKTYDTAEEAVTDVESRGDWESASKLEVVERNYEFHDFIPADEVIYKNY